MTGALESSHAHITQSPASLKNEGVIHDLHTLLHVSSANLAKSFDQLLDRLPLRTQRLNLRVRSLHHLLTLLPIQSPIDKHLEDVGVQESSRCLDAVVCPQCTPVLVGNVTNHRRC